MKEIDHILEKEISSNRSPSVQYYFFDRKDIIASFMKGYSDIANLSDVNTETTYHAFSVTKTFTALAILQLMESGKIDIDKPAIHYLPDFPYGGQITVRHVLTHSAGIPNPIPLNWIHLRTEKENYDRQAFYRGLLQKHNTPKSEPNARFVYSNIGYAILGDLIEQITGTTYEAYITERIIQKLPTNPGDLAFTMGDTSRHARGYHNRFTFSYFLLGFFIDRSKFMGKNAGRWKPFKDYYVNHPAYGGLIGSPSAFVKYIQELLSDETRLISKENKALLFQENRDNRNKATGMCLSWFIGQLNGKTYFTHAGGGGGYYCEIRLYPELGKGSVIFFNRTGMRDERFLDKVDGFYI